MQSAAANVLWSEQGTVVMFVKSVQYLQTLTHVHQYTMNRECGKTNFVDDVLPKLKASPEQRIQRNTRNSLFERHNIVLSCQQYIARTMSSRYERV